MNTLQLPSPIVQFKKREVPSLFDEGVWSQTNPNDLNQFPSWIIEDNELSSNILLLLWEHTQSACLIVDVATKQIRHANSHFHSILAKGTPVEDVKSPSIAYSSPSAVQASMLDYTSKLWRNRQWSDLIRPDYRENITTEIDLQSTWNGVFPLNLKEESWVSVSIHVIEGLCLLTFAELMPHDPLQLSTALLEARESEKQKGAFLANMSHEIRTPLHGILGHTSLLRETPLSPEQESLVMTIKQCSDGLLHIVNDILDYSRIEAGKMVFDNAPYELIECVKASYATLSYKAKEKQIGLCWSCAADVPKQVYGDPGRVRQVLVNLIANAVKFTLQGQVDIQVTSSILPPRTANSLSDPSLPTHEVRISVTDSGIGIQPDRFDYLFQAFHQAENNTSRQFGGSGLGLAISAKLVALQGGHIEVTSQPGVGSCFIVVLRVKAVPEEVPSPEIDLSDTRRSPTPSEISVPSVHINLAQSLPLDILVVEDNMINQRLALRLLEKLGYGATCVRVACNGLEAVSCVQRHSFDIIFMDVQMPLLNGLEATSRIRALPIPPHAQPYVVAMTANAMTGDDTKCAKAGMNAYIMKPFNLDHLSCAIVKAAKEIEDMRSRDAEVHSPQHHSGPAEDSGFAPSTRGNGGEDTDAGSMEVERGKPHIQENSVYMQSPQASVQTYPPAYMKHNSPRAAIPQSILHPDAQALRMIWPPKNKAIKPSTSLRPSMVPILSAPPKKRQHGSHPEEE